MASVLAGVARCGAGSVRAQARATAEEGAGPKRSAPSSSVASPRRIAAMRSGTLAVMGEDIERWFARSKARACGEKQRYADEQEALEAAYFVRLHTGERLSVYRCPFCRQWHLGHAAQQ